MVLAALGGLNVTIFLMGHIYLANNPGSGPGGVPVAFLLLATVGFSAFLTAGVLNFLYDEFKKRSADGRNGFCNHARRESSGLLSTGGLFALSSLKGSE